MKYNLFSILEFWSFFGQNKTFKILVFYLSVFQVNLLSGLWLLKCSSTFKAFIKL